VSLVYPYLNEKGCQLPLDDPTPTVVWAVAFGGAGRLWPTVNGMAKLLERKQVIFDDEAYSGVEEVTWPSVIEYRQSRLEASVKALGRYECLMSHHGYYDLEKIVDFPIKILALLRDPRDIYTSLCMRQFGYLNEEYVEYLMLKGDGHSLPNLRALTAQFDLAMSHPNIKAIRFEDINANPRAVYSDAFEWLGWRSSFFDDSEQVDMQLEGFIESALPVNQSKQQYVRGSVRQGKSQAWKSLWSDNLIDTYKRIAR
jgi:hypothetical protein